MSPGTPPFLVPLEPWGWRISFNIFGEKEKRNNAFEGAFEEVFKEAFKDPSKETLEDAFIE